MGWGGGLGVNFTHSLGKKSLAKAEVCEFLYTMDVGFYFLGRGGGVANYRCRC